MLAVPAYDKQFEYESPELLLPQGVEAITMELDKWYDVRVPQDFNWMKVDPKAGRVARRLSQLVHKQKRFDLPDDVLQSLVQLYDRYYSPPETHKFEFTGDFNWNPGDFGDPQSCFFGGSTARHTIRYNGGWAVRFYKNGKGYARAWMFNTDQGTGIMNAYGETLDRIGAILSAWSGLNVYRHVNYEFTDVDVYMNASGVSILSDTKPRGKVLLKWSGIPNGYKLPKNSEY